MGFLTRSAQLTVDGLMVGSLYAVIALGYTLVYGVLQLINFAHSEVFMLGAFGGLFAARALMPDDGSTPSGLASVGLVAVGLGIGALAGAAAAFTLERVAYRPLRQRGAPRLAFLISAIGASLFAVNLAGKQFGAAERLRPRPVHQRHRLHRLRCRGQNPDAGDLRRPRPRCWCCSTG